MFIQGVNQTRENNETNLDYLLLTSAESDGLRQYLHKFFLGQGAYYFDKELKKIHPEIDRDLEEQEVKDKQHTSRVLNHSLKRDYVEKGF